MNYISGGYYIISSTERQDYMCEEVLPTTILSVSECICDIHPEIDVLWAKSKKKKQQYAEQLEMSMEVYEEMEKCAEDMFESGRIGFPQMFLTIEAAREFCKRFLSDVDNITIIGIGLPEEFVEEFLEYEGVLEDTREYWYSMETLVVNKTELDTSEAKKLGYEVLGFDDGPFHSYLCNGLEKDFHREFNFVLNEDGFIPSLEKAVRYCEYSNDEEVGTEPVLWLPWAIFEYDK